MRYGDTIDHVDFAYLAKMTKLNVAALATIASAPPPPEPKVEGAVSTDTKILGSRSPALRLTRHWRRTDGPMANPLASGHAAIVQAMPRAGCRRIAATESVLPHIRVDDWVFGVSSVSKDGFESPVASAVPGGAFKPYVAPRQIRHLARAGVH